MKNRLLITILIGILAVLSITACAPGEPGESQAPEDPLDQLIRHLEKDKSGDKKTVYWDGEKAYIEDDPEDDPDIVYSYEELHDQYNADKLYEFEYPHGWVIADTDEEDPGYCHLYDPDNENTVHEAFVSPVNYEDAIDMMNSDPDYRATDDFRIADFQVKYLEEYQAYIGLKDFDGVKKVGFVLIFKSSLKEDTAYRVECYGLGEVLSVRRDLKIMIDHFDVTFL